MAKKEIHEVFDLDSYVEVDPLEIPFVFRNTACTLPASKELAEWLLFMLVNYTNSLWWLYRESQYYIHHGGGSVYTKENWLLKLERDCIKQLEKLNSE